MASTSSCPPQLSIFSLPHILQEIAYWTLSPKDLASCVRVNRTWHDAITPVLWRYFFLLNQSHIQTSSALRLAVSRNAHHVRYLVTSSTSLFEYLGSSCTNVRQLSYSVSHRPSQLSAESLIGLIMFFERQGPSGKFKEFITTQFPLDNEQQTRDLMRAIPRSVQKLWLCSPRAQYCPEGLVALLQSLFTKHQLEDLFVGVHFHEALDFHERLQRDAAFRNHMSLDPKTTSQHQHTYVLTLKKLSLVGDMVGYEDSILFPLLRLCPNLEVFHVPWITESKLNTMAEILRSHCPQLKDLTLGSHDFTDEQVAHLIDVGIKGTMERISLSGGIKTLTGRRSLELSELGTQRAVLGHASTLVVLRLNSCGLAVTSKWIQQILVQCSRLQEFRIVAPVVRAYPDEEPTGYLPLTNMGRLRRVLTGLDAIDIIQGEPWTCTNLRVLQLVIRSVPRSKWPPPVTDGMDAKQREALDEHLICEEPPVAWLKAESRWAQRLMCQRIGSLERLEELILGLNDGYVDILEPTVQVDPIQYHCLELSLETGLDALAGLKELRELAINGMDHAMGAPEIEWVVRQNVWPRLKRIEGMNNGKVRTPLKTTDRRTTAVKVASDLYLRTKFWMGWATVEDNPVEWLRRQRPSLAVKCFDD
ncbi:hypothetical protein BGZ59_000889 [Podila verticillata]|nr:hypothetical protein BGZ59_000889 [Podila verticillata]KAI9234918.1 MAG: hypothetical protein BYD32DRAFT_422394 [Podila humilis]KFH73425.1 hypothetical protein MVEG_00641 [Podila verticillata NRRL 6337]